MQVRLKSLPLLQRYYLGLVIAVFTFGMTIPLPWTVSTEGFIEPVHKQFIKPVVGGVIAEVLAESGQQVTAGQVIARLSDPQIAIDRAADRAAYEKAKLQLAYAKAMRRKGYLSELEVKDAELGLEVEKTKLQESTSFEIKAPISGTLITADELNLRVGDHIDAGTIIAAVADLNDMRIKVRVPESSVTQIKVGDEVRLYVNAYPAMLYSTMRGTVHLIQPQAQFSDGGNFFLVVIDLVNHLPRNDRGVSRLMPGMAGFAKIIYERSSFFQHVIVKSFDGFRVHA